jgi:hypothetical protein
MPSDNADVFNLQRPKLHIDPWLREVFEPRLAGFGLKELLELKRILDTRGITIEHALLELQYPQHCGDCLAGWKKHFGELTEIWA